MTTPSPDPIASACRFPADTGDAPPIIRALIEDALARVVQTEIRCLTGSLHRHEAARDQLVGAAVAAGLDRLETPSGALWIETLPPEPSVPFATSLTRDEPLHILHFDPAPDAPPAIRRFAR